MRCKVCDRDIILDFLSHFPDEDYCQTCEWWILETIEEMNREDEEVEDEPL